MPGTDIMTHSALILRPDPSRTVIRPFYLEDPAPFVVKDHPRAERILNRVLSLDDADLQLELSRVVTSLSERHRDVEEVLLRRVGEIEGLTIDQAAIGRDRALLIGAYFSEEYSFESAALFNPSIVLHSDQNGLPAGAVRFAMSLRGIGEGHVSSVTFRRGTWGADGEVMIDPPSGIVVSPQIQSVDGDGDDAITRIHFPGSKDVSETVLFPVTRSQRQGIEDLRLVRFVEEDDSIHYLGTYTAFSGSVARSEMLRAKDFKTFEMLPLHGSAAAAKGMALFPRRIGGRYAMLSRQDNENIWLLFSDDLYTW
ncbi:MAG: glycosidase, partial [Sphingomonas bacterium]|uniref:glycoside hydrolase family 130 protein n=1 Tax=Sphingomonas bacterium TaxID=1895847 RepID=UPI00260D3E9C